MAKIPPCLFRLRVEAYSWAYWTTIVTVEVRLMEPLLEVML